MWHSLIETLWSTVAYPVSLLLMVAVGYLVAERNYRRHALIWKPLGIESALITICSLLLSFTLLASNNALRGRAVLIHQTSDAVTELHPESQQLPPAYYAAVRAFLLRFLALGLRERRADQPPTAAHGCPPASAHRAVWPGVLRPQGAAGYAHAHVPNHGTPPPGAGFHIASR